MTSLPALYTRFRHLIHEWARYGMVGLSGLVLTDGGANLLRSWAGFSKLSATALAIVVATVVTFVGSRYWTFRDCSRSGMGRETALFLVVNGIAFAICEAFVAMTYPLHFAGGLAYNVALNAGMSLGAVIRYWSYRTWIWPPQQLSAGAVAY